MAEVDGYLYRRVSRPEQRDGHGPARQEEPVAAYCREHGIRIIERIDDLGISAYRGDNAETGRLGAFLTLVREDRIRKGSALIVESLDRLSRDVVRRSFPIFLNLLDAGITIHSLLDGQIYDAERADRDQFALMLSLMSYTGAHGFSRLMEQRSLANWAKKKAAARQGKAISNRCPHWLERVADSYRVIGRRAVILRTAVTWLAEGNGVRAVVRMLNAGDYPPPPGATRWSEPTLLRWVRSDSMLGYYQPHRVEGRRKRRPDGDPILLYPAIVESELLNRARAEIDGRRTGAAGRKGRSYSNLFSSIAKCRCGATMRIRAAGKRRPEYKRLVCAHWYEGGSCQFHGWFNYSVFEAAFLRSVGEIDLHRVNKSLDERESTVRKRRDLIEAEIKEGERQALNLMDALKEGPSPRIARELITLDDHLEKRRDERDRLSSEVDGIISARGIDHLAEIERLAATMENEAGTERYRTRALLAQEVRRVVERIEFDGRVRSASVHVKGDTKTYLIQKQRAIGFTIEPVDLPFHPLTLVHTDEELDNVGAEFSSIPGVVVQPVSLNLDERSPVEVFRLRRLADPDDVIAATHRGEALIVSAPPSKDIDPL